MNVASHQLRRSLAGTAYCHRGMTLLEVLVILVIIAIVAAILLPMMVTAREQARATQCRDQLRQLGLAFHAYAQVDPAEYFCSGAFDFVEDGCPDQFSWVASLRTTEGRVSGEPATQVKSWLICPGNPVGISKVLEDLLQADVSRLPPVDTSGTARWDTGFCNSRDGVQASAVGSRQRTDAVKQVLFSGWNTNYAASWHLVRGCPALWRSDRVGFDDNGQIMWELQIKTSDIFVGCPGLSHRNCTTGPLTMRMIDNADVPSSCIPFLGDAAPVRNGLRLSASVSRRNSRGENLAETYGRGPSVWDPVAGDVSPFSPPAPVPASQLGLPRPFKVGDIMSAGNIAAHAPGPQLSVVLQDTRHWSAVHLGQLQLLMADGSVKSVIDKNGDGFVNPGFPVERRTDESHGELQARTGYADGLVEVSGFEIFCATLLTNSVFTKNVFEEF